VPCIDGRVARAGGDGDDAGAAVAVAMWLSGEWKQYGRGRRRRGGYIGGTFSPGWTLD
jgi:hypothetical protein